MNSYIVSKNGVNKANKALMKNGVSEETKASFYR